MDKKARKLIPYSAYMLLTALWCALIIAAPLLLMANNSVAPPLYYGFSYACHQLNSRSLCYFPSSANAVSDCTASPAFSPAKTAQVTVNGQAGYKIPVCARDIGIYFAMLLGGLALPFVRKIEGEGIPNKWLLVVALIPIAIDGTGQLLGFWESTNAMRLWTGAAAGLALPFYIVPMANWAGRKIGVV